MISLIRPERVEARLDRHRWRWAEENDGRIREHWDRRRAAQPALFDGRVLMVSGAEERGDTLQVTFFETGYAQLLAHVDFGFPDPAILNGFAMGALRGSDGAFLLGEMASHTANAGRLYFPAGTPDLDDATPDGGIDLAGSILREIVEETGFAADECVLGETWTVIRESGRLALMRDVTLPISAEAAATRIRGFLETQACPELAAIHVVRAGDPVDERAMPRFLPVYLRDAADRARVQR